jgi:thiosulfate sulfurtransferase
VSRTGRILISAAIIVGASALWALAFNAWRPKGVAWVRETVSDQSGVGKMLTLPRAKQLFDTGALFVDTRTDDEFAAGHIRGALHLYYAHVEAEWQRALANVDFDQPIVCYCSGGGCNSSLIVADFLERQGFGKVYVFEGGWPAWSAAGYPLQGLPAPPPPLYREAQ